MASSLRTTSRGLVIVGIMEIIVLHPITSITGLKDGLKVLSNLTLVVLIRGERYAAGRVPTWALAMVGVLNLPPAFWV
jgi:hypothetical protein